MSTATTRATAALLCAVAIGALVFAFVGLPTSTAVAEPVNLDLNFDEFAPGVPQTRRSEIDVPVASTVRMARAEATMEFDIAFELCRLGACRALAAGDRIEPGVYSLVVSATLSSDLEPGTDATVFGQLQLAESSSGDLADPTTIVLTALLSLGGLLAVVLRTRRRATRTPQRTGVAP